MPQGKAVPEGRRPEGTALPEGIFLPRTKNDRGRGGYIVVYSPTRPHIYNKWTTFMSLVYKDLIIVLAPLVLFNYHCYQLSISL